jgi:hypothetical protein
MLEPLKAESLQALSGIAHGFFTRKGGVSAGIYATLNCGVGSADHRAAVAQNRARVASEMGVGPARLVTPYQIHSAHVVVVEEPWRPGPDAPRADAVVTRRQGLVVGVSTADCAPILFADVQARVVAAAHAGWRGALSGIIEATVAAMEGVGAARGHISAAIGPTISQGAYEVGAEFRDRFVAGEVENARFFSSGPGGRPHFDLPGFLRARLEAAGIGALHDLGQCTYDDEARFFSYRRSTRRGEPDYGRQLSAVALV